MSITRAPFFHLLIEGRGVEVRPYVRHVEGIVCQAIGHDLLLHLDGELEKALAIIFHSDLPRDILGRLPRASSVGAEIRIQVRRGSSLVR
jgi:hypothetical protein